MLVADTVEEPPAPPEDDEAVGHTVAPGDKDGVEVGDPVPPPPPPPSAAVTVKDAESDPPPLALPGMAEEESELEAEGTGGRVTVPVAPTPREGLGLDDAEAGGVEVAFTEAVIGAVPKGEAVPLEERVDTPDDTELGEMEMVPTPPLAVPCCCKYPDGELWEEVVPCPLAVFAAPVGVLVVVALPLMTAAVPEAPPETVAKGVLVEVPKGDEEPAPLKLSVLLAECVGEELRVDPFAKEGVAVPAPGEAVPSKPPVPDAAAVRVGVGVEEGVAAAAGERDTPGVPVPSPTPPPGVRVFEGDWEARRVEVVDTLGERPAVKVAGREEGDKKEVPVGNSLVALGAADTEGSPEPVALAEGLGVDATEDVAAAVVLEV